MKYPLESYLSQWISYHYCSKLNKLSVSPNRKTPKSKNKNLCKKNKSYMLTSMTFQVLTNSWELVYERV